MRLFLAVRPPDVALDHLESALASVRRDVDDRGPLRWTPPENRHVTLAFYGEVPEGYLDDMARAVDELAAGTTAFRTSLRGAGVFDTRTLWVGCSGGRWTSLMADAGAVGAELLGRREERRSRPHLTVARVRSAARARGRSGAGGGRTASGTVTAIAHALALYAGPEWTAASVALMSSRLGAGPSGTPRYDVVHRSELPAVAG